jgi:O-antigen ligase
VTKRFDTSDSLAFGLLLALLILTPWPLGSRLPWASMLAAGTVIAVGAVWMAGALIRGRRLAWHPLFLPIFAFLGWSGLQWAVGMTIYAHATAYEWIRYLSYGTVFALAVQTARHPDRARLLAKVIIVMAIAVGLFGLLQFLTWNGLLYWVYDPPYDGTRFGPFNNRNYFAGYMVAALAPAFGLILTGGRRHALLTALTGLAALSVFVCLSRGGAIGLATALVTVVVLGRGSTLGGRPQSDNARVRSSRGRALLLIGVFVALVAGLGLLQQLDPVLTRLETTLSFEADVSLSNRFEIWRHALTMAEDRPFVGFGLNTFGWAFPRYRREPTSSIVMHAHNEYLEMLIETGIVGAAICLWFVVVLFREAWRRLGVARSPWERGLRLGALAGWTGTMVYSLTDFPTIIPAINYVLAMLAALATTKLDAG